MPVGQAPGPGPVFPPGRYGRRRDPARQRRQRWLSYVIATMVVCACVAVAVKLYRQYAQAPYQVHIMSVTDLTDTSVTVTFEVGKPAGEPASCTVLGHTREGEQVGQATVDIPAGEPDQTRMRVTFTLGTSKRPVTAEVPGCGPLRVMSQGVVSWLP